MIKQLSRKTPLAFAAALLLAGATVAPTLAQRSNDWDWDGNYQRLARINPGTFVTVRTTQAVNIDRRDDRVYSGVVDEDVWDDYGRLSVPAIPRGSRVDLVVRSASDGDLLLDLDSIYAHGQRYTVTAAPERIETDNARPRDREDTAAYIGGGALLGTIIGAIAGGGKGAAIGAAAGAATGYGVSYRGRSIRVPSGSVLTFRMENGLTIGRPYRGTSGFTPRNR
jgi:hypothetical protein